MIFSYLYYYKNKTLTNIQISRTHLSPASAKAEARCCLLSGGGLRGGSGGGDGEGGDDNESDEEEGDKVDKCC